ncbi:hypothetical protein POF51_29590 [Brevibacillus sp. AG]|uniref:hypothetical protein n=1 Tax=Brevibacillus sp. AG TaxID=3020891 RepID=UPI00232E1631|nr:hypothetical protein [Brevibacillus sp. AG]MDC0764878.1 hypothetical protein [Brevibacillus sp. AG]
MTVISAFEYGKRAFEQGKPCAPAMDIEFLEVHLKEHKVGESINLLKEWSKGWANGWNSAIIQATQDALKEDK